MITVGEFWTAERAWLMVVGGIQDGGTAANDGGARLRHSWRNWSESCCLCGLQFAFHTPRIYNRDHFRSRR